MNGANATTDSPGWVMGRGAIFNSNRVYILARSERETGTRVFRWMEKWDNYYVPFVAVGICAVRSSPPEIVTVGASGSIHVAGPGGFSSEHVDKSDEGPEHRGILRGAQVIEGQVYVTGMGRQVYRRRSPGRWERLDRGVLDPKGSNNVCGFESIAGFSRDELYAVGFNGEIAVCREGAWQIVETPTNMILHKVLCAPNGTAYAVGRVGVILAGRGDKWEMIPQQLTDDTFWDAAWYAGSVWLATPKALYRLDPTNKGLVQVETGIFPKDSCGYLDASDSVLWSFGAENLAIWDDSNWRIISPP